jgi:hypothetical protein
LRKEDCSEVITVESVKRMFREKKIVQTLKEPETPLKPKQSTAKKESYISSNE